MGGFNFGIQPQQQRLQGPGQVHRGGPQNLGLMPYQPNPVASAMTAFGDMFSGLAAIKDGQKQKARQDLESALSLQAQGLPAPDPQKMAKLAKKAGLGDIYDFDNPDVHVQQQQQQAAAMSPSQLGVSQNNPMAPPVAPPPVGPQAAPDPNIGLLPPQQQAPPPPPAGPPATGSFSQGPIAPDPMPGQQQMISPQPHGFMDKLKGGLYAATGLGSPNVNMQSQGAQATQQMMDGARQSGQLQRMMAGLQTQNAIGDMQEKMATRDLLHGAMTGVDASGKRLSPDAMYKIQTILTQKGVFQKLDITDIPALRELSGAGFGAGGEDKLADTMWKLKDPGGRAKYVADLQKDYRDRGMSEEDIDTAVRDRLANRAPSVPIPPSIELSKEHAAREKQATENEKQAVELIPGLEKQFKKNPTLQDLARRGMFGAILNISELKTKASLEADKTERELRQGDQRIGLQGFEAQTGRMNAGTNARNAVTSEGQLGVAQEGLGLRKTEQAIDATTQSGAAVKAGSMSNEQREQILRMISGNVKGSVSPVEKGFFGGQTGATLNANAPFPMPPQTRPQDQQPGSMDATQKAFGEYMRSGASQRIPFDIWVDELIKNATRPNQPNQTPPSPLLNNFIGN